jgi:hypothetical protein
VGLTSLNISFLAMSAQVKIPIFIYLLSQNCVKKSIEKTLGRFSDILFVGDRAYKHPDAKARQHHPVR